MKGAGKRMGERMSLEVMELSRRRTVLLALRTLGTNRVGQTVGCYRVVAFPVRRKMMMEVMEGVLAFRLWWF